MAENKFEFTWDIRHVYYPEGYQPNDLYEGLVYLNGHEIYRTLIADLHDAEEEIIGKFADALNTALTNNNQDHID